MMTVRSKLFSRNFVIAIALGALSGGAFSAEGDPRAAEAETKRVERSAEQRALLHRAVEEQAAQTLDALNAEWLADVQARLKRPASVIVAAN